MKILKRDVSFAAFANTFVPFGLLMVAALLAAELTQNLTLYREVYTIWASTVLLAPALVLFTLPGGSKARTDYWLLLWTFSYVAYLAHFYYGVFVTFDGSLSALFAGQGVFAAFNLIVTAWWGFDVVLAWVQKTEPRWVRLERIGAHAYVWLVYVTATLLLFEGFVRVLGTLLLLATVAALAYRLVHARTRRRPLVAH